MVNQSYKTTLYKHCIEILEGRISANRRAMADAQDSANSEEKSSAGDKYETGRAMSHLNRDMSARQLKTAMDELQELLSVDISVTHPSVQKGSLVEIVQGTPVFIAAGLGMIDYDGMKVAVVSPKSPLAIAIMKCKKGDTITFNGKTMLIATII